MTVLPIDWDEAGVLHHFILAFETIRLNADQAIDPKEQLTLYYEQLKQSILENDSYVDALLDMAGTIYTVNLTRDTLERNISPAGKSDSDRALFLDYPLPCSYRDYCDEYRKRVTPATLGSYRTADTSARLLKRFAAGEKHITVEYCVQEDDGAIRWVQKTALMTQTTVFDPEINAEMPMVTAIILLQDTSQMHARDEQENARLQAAFDEMRIANRTKTEFLSRMSHDIRTPINGIRGMVDICRYYIGNPKKQEECLDKILLSSTFLMELVNDVLDMNKLESGQIKLEEKPFSISEILKEVETVVGMAATEQGITLTVKKGEINHENLLGSSLHVRQILQNITSNAVKYNKPNGKVILECRELPPKNEKAVFEFVCTDNGIGMSPEFQEHAFEPFVQENSSARTSYTGTGLGLAIVKKLVEQMEGTIHFVSEPGKGTRFTLVIPFLPDDSIEMQTEQTQSTDAVKGIENDKILLVEDYEINMEIARFVLENEGAQVQEAWNGKEAVDLFAASEPGGYDVILMDLMMPVMGGLEAAQCIRKLEREDAKTVPIIAMTANAFADDEERSLAAGMDAHISKPLDAEKLIQVISDICKKRKEHAKGDADI